MNLYERNFYSGKQKSHDNYTALRQTFFFIKTEFKLCVLAGWMYIKQLYVVLVGVAAHCDINIGTRNCFIKVCTLIRQKVYSLVYFLLCTQIKLFQCYSSRQTFAVYFQTIVFAALENTPLILF